LPTYLSHGTLTSLVVLLLIRIAVKTDADAERAWKRRKLQRLDVPLCSLEWGSCGGRPTNGASARLHERRLAEKGEVLN
jgi:hypothetical protein